MTERKDNVVTFLALLISAALGAATIAVTGQWWAGALVAAALAGLWLGIAKPRLDRTARANPTAESPDERYVRH